MGHFVPKCLEKQDDLDENVKIVPTFSLFYHYRPEVSTAGPGPQKGGGAEKTLRENSFPEAFSERLKRDYSASASWAFFASSMIFCCTAAGVSA